MTPANCQERHLPWIMERDGVVGTSLRLIYLTCTLPGPNAVQIYRLRTAQTPQFGGWRRKRADVMCEIPSKPVNTVHERAKFRNGGFSKLSLEVWLWTEEGFYQYEFSSKRVLVVWGFRAALLLMPDAESEFMLLISSNKIDWNRTISMMFGCVNGV